MIETLNGVTTNASLPLMDFAAAASKFGIPGIEFDAGQLANAIDAGKTEETREQLAELGVSLQVFGLPIDWRGAQTDFDQGIASLARLAGASQQFGCTRCCTWIPPSTDSDVSDFHKLAVNRFRSIATVFGDYGVNFGLEFVGPQTLREGPKAMGKNVFLWNIPGLLDLISEINAPSNNVGILLDSFHWFCTAGTSADILSLRPDQIVHVHINDAPDRSLSDQMDFERLLPGDGVIDLPEFITSLEKISYRGPIAAEIFNSELKSLSTEDSIDRVSKSVKRLLNHAPI